MKPDRLFYGFAAETVFDPQAPIERESILSWIARTTLENELPNITTIMGDVGQAHRNRVADITHKAIDVEGLAVILGRDLPTVQSMRGQSVGNGFMRYLGAIVKSGDVHTRERRFAPASLAMGRTPFYRASWLIRTFPACVDSWQTLRSTCQCGTVQTWATVSTLVFCEGCGEDLRELTADVVPEEFRSGLAFLGNILFGEAVARAASMAQLPAELQALDPGEVYELALLMARIVDPSMANPRERVWRDEPARLARALSTAGPLLTRWPETPWLALEAAGNPKAILPRCEPLKALYRVLNGDFATNVAPSIRSALDHMRLDITVDGEVPRDDLIDVNEAAEILHARKRNVGAARTAGHLGAHFLIRRGEILPAYARGEVEALAATVGWPSAALVGKQLGLPPYGVEQLCAMNQLSWAKAPYRTLRTGLYIDPQSAVTFEEKLRSSAASLEYIADPVPLSLVLRGIGGREKPWGPVLRGLLDGAWSYALGRDGCVVREIYVDATDIDSVRQMTFDAGRCHFPFAFTIVQADACDILNVTVRNRYEIERYKVGDRRSGWVFDQSAVIRLAADIVTSAELQARHLKETKTTMATIRRVRLKPLMFGFEREAAIKKFDAALL